MPEFWLLINLISSETVIFDFHQSKTPDLTEIFWTSKNIARTNWSDTKLRFSVSKLRFDRIAIYKDGDLESWEEISSSELAEG